MWGWGRWRPRVPEEFRPQSLVVGIRMLLLMMLKGEKHAMMAMMMITYMMQRASPISIMIMMGLMLVTQRLYVTRALMPT